MTTNIYDDVVHVNTKSIASPTYNAILAIKTAEVTLSALSGATVSATNLIPAGSIVFGVTVRVITLIAGPTTFTIGDGTTANLFGATIGLAAGTTTSSASFLSTFKPTFYASATSVVLTGTGGSFSAGAVHVVAHYYSVAGPTL